MIAHLQGKLELIDPKYIVIDVANVGYKVFLPSSALPKLPKIGSEIKVFTYQVVREDDISLYGFLAKEEKALFSSLITVNGVGPKVALSLISGFPIDKLVAAITCGNVDLIVSVPGVGTKTAQKIIIDLKEKLAKTYGLAASDLASTMPGDEPILKDAISALITLGYSPREAKEAILKSGVDLASVKRVEDLIKQTLKFLG